MARENLSAIYAWRNCVNGKKYVGSGIDALERRNDHLYMLRRGRSHCPHLQAAWTKYGEDSFEWGLIEVVADPAKLIEREQFWMDMLQSYDRRFGYNARPMAGNQLGLRHSDVSRAKISASKKGKKQNLSDEQRAAISARHKGRKRSPETGARISAANTGRKMSPEAIEKMAASHRGKPETAETRAKLSALRKGKRPSDICMEAMRAANTGRKLTPEHIAKASAARIASGKSRVAAFERWAKWTPERRAEIAANISAGKKAKRSHWTPEMVAANEERKRLMERDRLRAKRAVAKAKKAAERNAAQPSLLAAD